MPLEKQLLDIPFSGSMQDQVDERLVPNEQLLTVGNMVYRKDGRLSQRYGWDGLGNVSGFTSESKSLVTFGENQLGVVTADAGVVAWSPRQEAWKDTEGDVPPTSVDTSTLHYEDFRGYQADCAVVNGYIAYVWSTQEVTSGAGATATRRVYGQVRDTSGHIELPTFELPSDIKHSPHVIGINNTFVFFGMSQAETFNDLDTGSALYAATLSTAATLTPPSSATELTDFPDPGFYDVHAPDPLVNAAYIVAYEAQGAAGGPGLRVGRIDSALTVDDTDSTSQDINGFLTLFYSTAQSKVYILYGDDIDAEPYDVHVRTKPVGSGTLSSATVVGQSSFSAGHQAAIGQYNDAEDNFLLLWPGALTGIAGHRARVINESVTPVTIVQDFGGYAVSSKVSYVSGVGAVFTVIPRSGYVTDLGNNPTALYAHQTLVTPRTTSHTAYRSLARVHYGRGLPPLSPHLGSWAEVSPGKIESAMPVLETFSPLIGGGGPVSNNLHSFVKRTSVDFSAESMERPDELNGNALVPGGLVSTFDGVRSTPSGFGFAPILVHAEDNTQARKIRVVFEWRDATGNTHRSPPSTAYFPNSSNEIQVLQPFEDPTRGTSASCIIKTYWSDTSFTNFYLHEKFELEKNDGTSPQTISVNTIQPDTAQEKVYTAGGVLSSDPAPPMNWITSGAGRLWGVYSEDPRVVYYSKRGERNIATEWNESLAIHLPEDTIKAIGTMDDKVVLFTEDGIYVTAGEGPTRAGSGDFPRPQKIQAVGLRDAESVVSTPVGLFYSSYEGIYLLDRGLSNQYVGGGIEDRLFNSSGTRLPVIAAVHLPRETEVRFLLQNKDPVQSDLVLVYNYQFGRWSYFDNHNGIDAINWDGTFVHLNDSPEVRYEVEEQYFDGTIGDESGKIIGVVDTAWIRVGSIEGLQRIRKLVFTGLTDADHPPDLSVQVYYNYEGPSTKTKQYNGRVSDGLSPDDGDIYPILKDTNFFELQWGLPRQKCAAIRFRFTWNPTGAWPFVGQGGSTSRPSFIDLISMTLEVGQKRNTFTHGTDHRGSTPSS